MNANNRIGDKWSVDIHESANRCDCSRPFAYPPAITGTTSSAAARWLVHADGLTKKTDTAKPGSSIQKTRRLLIVLSTFGGALGCGAVDDTSVRSDTIGDAPMACEAAHNPWSFGVMSDLQWAAGSVDPSGRNSPEGGVTLTVFDQIAAQFIAKGVKFVISTGDQINRNGDMSVAGAAVQSLYDAGIGFFPIRGNHEADTADNISSFRVTFPQTRKGGDHQFGATRFNSPNDFFQDGLLQELDGLSYSFDYLTEQGSVRILLLDDWSTPNRTTVISGLDAYPYGYTMGEHQGWITNQLSTRAWGQHAFVFSHHNLMPEFHYDSLFTGYADANLDMQNAFFASLSDNAVKYFISGHEHVYNRSIITSPDGKSSVQEIICASTGSKLLAPKDPAGAGFYGQKSRQTQVSQELSNIGFYIFTVDGPRVTVDYYADSVGHYESDSEFPDGTGSLVTPVFDFVKTETWGYGLNGKEFVIPSGASYSVITDSYAGTTASVLSGFNDSTGTDHWGRPLTKSVTTGWSERAPDRTFRSKIITLWGMQDFGTDETDVYTLQLTYEPGHTRHIGRGRFGIATRNAKGNWINAVDANQGGMKSFVMGPWQHGYGLGTYGVDPSTNTVWAVLNHGGDFVVKNEIEIP